LLIFVLIVMFSETSWLGRLLYPIHYQNIITEHAEKRGVDPFLLTAIIRVESNFKPDKESRKGALGLMQLMPATAEWAVNELGYGRSALDRLREPEINIEIGAWYVETLHRQFIGEKQTGKDREIALIAAAYNAGSGNVAKWLESGQWNGELKNAEQIPFGETRHYIHRIHYYYKKYMQIYPELSDNNR